MKLKANIGPKIIIKADTSTSNPATTSTSKWGIIIIA
jgi:hypothetical protein